MNSSSVKTMQFCKLQFRITLVILLLPTAWLQQIQNSACSILYDISTKLIREPNYTNMFPNRSTGNIHNQRSTPLIDLCQSVEGRANKHMKTVRCQSSVYFCIQETAFISSQILTKCFNSNLSGISCEPILKYQII